MESELDEQQEGGREGEVSFALFVPSQRGQRLRKKGEKGPTYDDVIASVRDESEVERV